MNKMNMILSSSLLGVTIGLLPLVTKPNVIPATYAEGGPGLISRAPIEIEIEDDPLAEPAEEDPQEDQSPEETIPDEEVQETPPPPPVEEAEAPAPVATRNPEPARVAPPPVEAPAAPTQVAPVQEAETPAAESSPVEAPQDLPDPTENDDIAPIDEGAVEQGEDPLLEPPEHEVELEPERVEPAPEARPTPNVELPAHSNGSPPGQNSAANNRPETPGPHQ